jgi:hypothetical protein
VRTSNAPKNEILQAALQYAERGWLVFPCDNESKRPLTERGLKDATRNKETITQWFTHWPGAMIGIKCGRESGIFVIDCDVDPAVGLDAVATFKELVPDLPETITVKTPRGGRHYYFAYPNDGTEVRNSASKICTGCDVRGEGGYVITAGSRRSDGIYYETLAAVHDVPDAPRSLIDLVASKDQPAASARQRSSNNGKGYGAAALDAECAKVASAPKGQRNHTLNAAAFSLGQLVGGGVLDEGEVKSRLHDAADACGLSKDDGRESVKATINSGLSAGLKQPRQIPERQETQRAKNKDDAPPPPQPHVARFKLVRFNEITLQTTTAYLVAGLIPCVGLIVIWGPEKCGKSFWTFDLFMHVALGWLYRGRKVRQGEVVYLALEGHAGFNRRAEAFRQKHKVTDAPFYLITARTDLVKDHAALIAAIKAQSVNPAAVVIDTLNRSFSGSESKDEDMGAYIKAADAVREAFSCAVVIIHHCGINETRPRGHTSLGGAVDAQLAVKRDTARNVVVEVEWMKDGDSEGDVIISKLERVPVGTDDDGNALSSCVVLPSEAPAADTTDDGLSKNQKTMFSILYDAGPRGLTLTEWHKAARDAGIGTKRKADLFDLRTAIQHKGMIYQSGDRWIARRK